jgi:hypothetical protein
MAKVKRTNKDLIIPSVGSGSLAAGEFITIENKELELFTNSGGPASEFITKNNGNI